MEPKAPLEPVRSTVKSLVQLTTTITRRHLDQLLSYRLFMHPRPAGMHITIDG